MHFKIYTNSSWLLRNLYSIAINTHEPSINSSAPFQPGAGAETAPCMSTDIFLYFSDVHVAISLDMKNELT